MFFICFPFNLIALNKAFKTMYDHIYGVTKVTGHKHCIG